MEIIDIACPRSINLLSINKVNDKDIKSILQTINVYDHIIINQNIKNKDNVLINTSNNITKGTQEKLNELLLIFANYINMKINNISLDIHYDEMTYLRNEESILAGFLLALNYYFKNNLTTHELIYLANKIDNLISYYIVGGYKKIDINNKNISVGKNIYNKYYLLENSDNIETLKKIFDEYHIIYGCDNCYFVPIKDFVPSNMLISLKREFPNIIFRTINNTKDHKILVKYVR